MKKKINIISLLFLLSTFISADKPGTKLSTTGISKEDILATRVSGDKVIYLYNSRVEVKRQKLNKSADELRAELEKSNKDIKKEIRGLQIKLRKYNDKKNISEKNKIIKEINRARSRLINIKEMYAFPCEEISRRNVNSLFFKIGKTVNGDEIWRAKFYCGQPFYKEGDKWYQTETGVAGKAEFDKIIRENFVIKLYKKIKKFLFKKAYAGTQTVKYYAGAGDGAVDVGREPDWNTAHNKNSGWDVSDSVNYTNNLITGMDNPGIGIRTGRTGYSEITIVRAFFPIDTSSLHNAIQIQSSRLALCSSIIHDEINDSYSYLAIVSTSQASLGSLIFNDYIVCGDAIDNPTTGSFPFDISTAISGSYYYLDLNSTGINWINKTNYTKIGVRSGNDIEDYFPGKTNQLEGIITYTSEQTGISQDPYLEVTYITKRVITTD